MEFIIAYHNNTHQISALRWALLLDREAALQKMRSALDEMVVMGVETNLDFQYQIMKNQVFCDGKADTGFIENVLKIKG